MCWSLLWNTSLLDLLSSQYNSDFQRSQNYVFLKNKYFKNCLKGTWEAAILVKAWIRNYKPPKYNFYISSGWNFQQLFNLFLPVITRHGQVSVMMNLTSLFFLFISTSDFSIFKNILVLKRGDFHNERSIGGAASDSSGVIRANSRPYQSFLRGGWWWWICGSWDHYAAGRGVWGGTSHSEFPLRGSANQRWHLNTWNRG